MAPEVVIQGAGFDSEEKAKAVAAFLDWYDVPKRKPNEPDKLISDLIKCSQDGTPSQCLLMRISATFIATILGKENVLQEELERAAELHLRKKL